MRGEAPSASRRHRALHDAWWSLAVVIFLGGVACVVIGVAPPPGVVDPVPPLLSGVVFVLIALGLVVFRGAARARQLALWATLVTTGVMIGQTVTGAGQILVADGVVLGALYAGATMVGRELVLYLASASVVVTVGMIGSSAPFLPVACSSWSARSCWSARSPPGTSGRCGGRRRSTT
ncbi:hypothetical protein [Cellulomonas fimi]|uniref:Uncharacterized protein n=1 Tax=Cellulomonas fimi TaxID=1708 RepID=A0A7Y0M056_CELFI|nr:hypothetical protein [Cellulomonas fimi]NMR21413.1 hypothetical protein [Cellulomonas fimi]